MTLLLNINDVLPAHEIQTCFALRVPTLASGFDGGACQQKKRDVLLGG